MSTLTAVSDSQDFYVIHRHVMTSVKWGATRSNTIKMFRLPDKHIPVFTKIELAYRFLAGYYRPAADVNPRTLKTVSWPGNWKIVRHDWNVSKRSVKLTKLYVVDPEPPQQPMESGKE